MPLSNIENLEGGGGEGSSDLITWEVRMWEALESAREDLFAYTVSIH